MEISTNVKKPKPYILKLKSEEIRLTVAKGEVVQRWLSDRNASRFFELMDDEGNFWMTIDKNDVRGLELKKVAVREDDFGYNCKWGKWHEVYPANNECHCWKETGIDPWTVQDVRKQLFPDWKYGNAMTPSMRNACYAHATKLLTK